MIGSTIRPTSGLLVVRVIVRARRAGLELVEQTLDPILSRDRIVVEESDLGNTLQMQAPADPAAQERGGALQCTSGGAAAGFVAQRRVVHPRRLQVGAD